MWKYTGRERPPFAEKPGAGQESVWDYPRPPRLERDHRLIAVKHGDRLIAQTSGAIRVLETASPPTFYIPDTHIVMSELVEAAGSSFCEWKGRASYRALRAHPDLPVGWYYQDPQERYAPISGHTAFYPGRIACYVDDERVRPQPGGFYGGWITNEIVGPVKGGPGTGGW
jgi:uncharacterized protein (DUF427 family)